MIYLASRRALSANGQTFTAKPGNTTSFLRTAIPNQSHTPAQRIDPRVWAQEALNQGNNGHVLLVIHGFRIPQHSFLKEVSKVRKKLGSRFRGAVVGLDWPTNGRLFDYRKDLQDAKKTAGPLFRDAVEALHLARPSVKLHILAHSMGCLFTSVALQSALGSSLETKLRGSLRTIAVTGADVDQDWTTPSHPFSQALGRTCRRFIVHHSAHDEVLHVSEDRFHGGRKRLGRDGPAASRPAVLLDVPWTDYYRQNLWRPFAPRRSHNFYYDEASFYATLAPSLQ